MVFFLLKVYETVETMLLNPEEALRMLKQTEESPTIGESKGRFKRLRLIFGGKNNLRRKSVPKEQISSEENHVQQSFSSFFDSKSSLFSKKPPKSGSQSPAEKPCPESDWTVV